MARFPTLDRISGPADMKGLSVGELRRLADELREELIESVSQTGGHLGSSLGVVELTVAIHAVFDTPSDRLVWDVGHQCYPHKILTGRRERIRTLRQGGGLSGFTRRAESEYDPFGAAHSSTSISAGLGMGAGVFLEGPTFVAKMSAELRKALEDPAVKAQLESQGATVVGSNPSDAAAFHLAEMRKFKRAVEISGAKAEQ